MRENTSPPPEVLAWPGVVVLSGSALRTASEACLIAIRSRRLSGLPVDRFTDLVAHLMTAMGQQDVREPPGASVSLAPTVPISEAAEQLGRSRRQTRRLVRGLGGRKIDGRWLVDRIAPDECRQRKARAAHD
jgi:hypothetical protein